MQQQSQVEVYEYFLKPGFIMANADDTIVRTVLGNCVAVSIYDRANRFGGMNHFLFPAVSGATRPSAQYGDVAVPTLFKLLLELGAEREAVEAQIFGGATRHDHADGSLGSRNVEAARNALRRLSVPVVSEDVGGERGRKVIFHTGTSETIVYKVEKIRDGDWFLPGQDLRFAGAR